MSKEKQIEEMAKDVTRSICWCNEEIPTVDGVGTAITLYNKGYRKSSEVAEEIFDEIEFEIHQLDFDREETRAIAIEGIIANAKKKYTEGN